MDNSESNLSVYSDFENQCFPNELNHLVGSGGEVLLKGDDNSVSTNTQIDVGDVLVGIGITHYIESLNRPPGSNSFRPLLLEGSIVHPRKMAARAMMVHEKMENNNGYYFTFRPLDPPRYSSVLERVSDGVITVHPDTIPQGTIILSFLSSDSTYTLQTMEDSPRANWVAIEQSVRHWNVGVGKQGDFWEASFPSDDIGVLANLPPTQKIGDIRFGLSMLDGSRGATGFEQVDHTRLTGDTSSHHFCLAGAVIGTQDIDLAFPIGLRTEITCHPLGG